METSQQEESELESTDVTKWIEKSLSHLASCLKKAENAADLEIWPSVPSVLKNKDDFNEDGFSSTIESIIKEWDNYWKSCTELRRTDVYKAIIQIETLTSKSSSTNLRGIAPGNYHKGMLKDPVFITIQDIWNKWSNGLPFTDENTEDSSDTEYSSLEKWFLSYLQYLESVLNLENGTYFIEDLLPKPPPHNNRKITQSLKKIVASWNKLWLSKLSIDDVETTKYIDAMHLIFIIGIPTAKKKEFHWKKLENILHHVLGPNTEKMETRLESTQKMLPEDVRAAFKIKMYEKILDVLEDRINIDVMEPPPVPNECHESLKEQLNVEFEKAIEALKKKTKFTEDLDRINQEKEKCEEKVKMLQDNLRKAHKEVERSTQFLKNIMELVEGKLPTAEDKSSLQYDDTFQKLEKRLETLKSEIATAETEKSRYKSDTEENISRLQQELDKERKASELRQQTDKLKSGILKKTMASILPTAAVQFTTDDIQSKCQADVWKKLEPYVQKMKSYIEKFEFEKSSEQRLRKELEDKNQSITEELNGLKSSGNDFKLHTMEHFLTALKNNSATITADVNADMESYDENTRKGLQKWYQKVQKQLNRLLNEKEESQREIESLKQKLAGLEENREELLNRLSQIAGAKLKENNPNITDLSDPNRPLKIAEQFSELYDKEWTNALEELCLAKMVEKTAIGLLLESVTNCYHFCLRNSEHSVEAFLMCDDSDWRNGLNADENHLLSETRKSLAKVHIRQIKKKFAEVNMYDKKTQKTLSPFVEKSLELCWYMVIQNPPIHMEVHFPAGTSLTKNTLKEYTISGDTMSFLVWPPLYLHKDGPLISKGVAQPLPKPNRRRHKESMERPSTAPR